MSSCAPVLKSSASRAVARPVALCVLLASLLALLHPGVVYAITASPVEDGSTFLPAPGQGLNSGFGESVALAANGESALIGSPGQGAGSAVIFTHSGNWWAQRDPQLTPAGASGEAAFGSSVTLTPDADLALVGGPRDDAGIGAVWVFARSGEAWSQQAPKLAPRDALGSAGFGTSVAVSSNGRIALVGGPHDDGGTGAAWVFRRSGSAWTEDLKLVPREDDGSAEFGSSVALSSDGSTLLVGGPGEGAGSGAVWVFRRAGASWSQSGAKVVPPKQSSGARFGASVALSSAGTAMLVGEPGAAPGGAAWGLARVAGTWAAQGPRLIGPQASIAGRFGTSVSLDASGRVALVGTPTTAGSGNAVLFTLHGSAWIRPGAPLGQGAVGGSFGTSVALAATDDAVLAGGPGDIGEGQARLVQLGTTTPAPWCFGAAARDPEHPCSNPHTALMVTPSPAGLASSPNAACVLVGGDGIINSCAFGVPAAASAATVALIGDSHVIHWRAALEVVAQSRHWEGLSSVRSGCPFEDATSGLPEPLRAECDARNRAIPRWLAHHPAIHTVFTAEHAGGDVATARSAFASEVAGYVDAWRALPRSVTHIVVIRDNPQILPNTIGCVQHAIEAHRPAGSACAVPRSQALGQDPAAAAAAELHSRRVQVVDLTPFFCDSRLCYPVIGGVLAYRDANHLTSRYATSLGPYLQRELDRLMATWRVHATPVSKN